MGSATSVEVNPENTEEYKLTNADVIQLQSILLGLHNSISELHSKQNELKRLILNQNDLFVKQNEVIKTLATAVDGPPSSDQGPNKIDKARSESPPPLEQARDNEERPDSPHSDQEEPNEPDPEPVPASQVIQPVSISNTKTQKPHEVKSKVNETPRVRNVPVGVYRLFKLDITVTLATLSQTSLDETAEKFERILSKGPIGDISQYCMAFDAILESIFEEPARSTIMARLIHKTTGKIPPGELPHLQRACRESLEKHFALCEQLEGEAQTLTAKGYHSTSAQDGLSHKMKRRQRNKWLHGLSRFVLELCLANVLPPKEAMDIGDMLLKKSSKGDDVAASCLHLLLRKLESSSDVSFKTFKQGLLVQQWMDKVLRGVEGLMENECLSMSSRIAFADLNERKRMPVQEQSNIAK